MIKLLNILNEVRVKKTDRVVLYNTPELLVISPLTHTASCKYGAFSTWCVAVPAVAGKTHFENYTKEAVLIYFLEYETTNGKRDKIITKYALNINFIRGTESWYDIKDASVESQYDNYPQVIRNLVSDYVKEKREEFIKGLSPEEKIHRGLTVDEEEIKKLPPLAKLRFGYRRYLTDEEIRSLSISERYHNGFRDYITDEEILSLSIRERLDKGFREYVTDREIGSLSPEVRLKYDLKNYLSEEEIRNLPIHIKNQYKIGLTSEDEKLKEGSLHYKLERYLNGGVSDTDMVDVITGDNGYEDVRISNDTIIVDFPRSWGEGTIRKYYSGVDGGDFDYYIRLKYNDYDYGYEVDSSELEYINGWFNLDSREKLNRMSNTLEGFEFDFYQNNGQETIEFLETYFPNKTEKFTSDFLSELSEAYSKRMRKDIVGNYEDSLRFKIEYDELHLPMEELKNFLSNKPHVKFLKDLEKEDINDGAYFDYESYEFGYSDEDRKSIENTVNDFIDDIYEEFESDDKYLGIKEFAQKFEKMMTDLKFEKIGKDYVKKMSDGKVIKITDVDYDDEMVLIDSWDGTKLVKSKIPFGGVSSFVLNYKLQLESFRQKQMFTRMMSKNFNID